MSAVSSVPPSRTKTLSHSCYCPPPPSLLVHCQERRPMHQSCAEDAGAHREEHMLLQRTIHLRTFVSVHNVACMSFGLCTFDLSVCRQRRQELVHSSDADRSSGGLCTSAQSVRPTPCPFRPAQRVPKGRPLRPPCRLARTERATAPPTLPLCGQIFLNFGTTIERRLPVSHFALVFLNHLPN